MNTNSTPQPRPIRRGRLHLSITRILCLALAATAALFNARIATAANIVWVSDANDPAIGFFPAGSGYTDSAFVALLQNAGHNVIRYNQPNAQATMLTAAELTALNTNDLVIIGRCVGSGAFQPPQGEQWNVAITKPLIDMSPFHVRREGPNRLGWFLGNTSDNFDDTPTVLNAVLTGNPATDAVVDYLFAGVAMKGTNTALPYDETLDRNTSHIAGAPVAGGIAYATANYIQQNNAAIPPAMNFGNVIVGFPAGTAVRYDTNILAGYRMFFAGGSRESGSYPAAIPVYAGRETLTATGEDIFLRAVQVAINNGVAPATDPSAPPSIVTQPVSVTVNQGGAAGFSISTAGAGPRSVQWQRDTGDGITFTNIPDASTPFLNSRLALPVVDTADGNAKFRVEVSNGFGAVTSDAVTLTVTPDAAPPEPLSATSQDGLTIGLCFDEIVDPRPGGDGGGTAVDGFNYTLTDPINPTASVGLVEIRPDGRSLVLHVVNGPLGPGSTLNVARVEDRFANAIPDAGVDLAVLNLGFTALEVGSPGPAGANYSCHANTFEVSGGAATGGSSTLANDITATLDHFRFVHKTVNGDFDARVRVVSLLGPLDHLEATAKAILGARATADANSPSVNVFVTPAYPADNSYGATARTAVAAPTSSNFVTTAYAPSAIPVPYPNAWMRITRVGDLFSTFRSANGTDWSPLGNITVAMGPSAMVGAGAGSHRNGRLATGAFSDFQLLPVPRIINLSYTAGSFSGQLETWIGFTYQVQYKDNLEDSMWTDLSSIIGDGSIKFFADPGPAGPHRFYRVVVP